MKQLLAICGILLCLFSTGCKRKYDDTIVSGIVTDSTSGTPLHGATMQLKSGTFFYGKSDAETITDAEGYYQLVYDTPSEGTFSLPSSYEVFALKPGYALKRAQITPGTNSRRNFALGEKYLQVKITTFNYYNNDSTVINITGEGKEPITDTFTFYPGSTPYPEKNYFVRVDTNLQFTITKFRFGTGSATTYEKQIEGDEPITINLPV